MTSLVNAPKLYIIIVIFNYVSKFKLYYQFIKFIHDLQLSYDTTYFEWYSGESLFVDKAIKSNLCYGCVTLEFNM